MSQEIANATENLKKAFIDQYYNFLKAYVFGRDPKFAEWTGKDLLKFQQEHPVASESRESLPPFFWAKSDSGASRVVFIVDVRESKERAVSMIPNSVTTTEMLQTLAKIADNLRAGVPKQEKKTEVVILCYDTVGKRSGEYLNFLSASQKGDVVKKEYADIFEFVFVNLHGGIAEWSWTDGAKIVKRKNENSNEYVEADTIHVKNNMWNLANENKYKIICEEN